MTYGYFTADISTGVTCAHSTRPSPGCASGVLRNGHSFPPADAFVVSAQHNAPPPNRRVPIQPAYSAEQGVINNLFNEEYQSVLSRPMPRLNYEIFLDIRPKWGKRNKKQ